MPQELKFKNIYLNSKEEVKRTLTSLWTGVGTAQFENNLYKEQIAEAIENVFAPDNETEKAEPLVQSMYKWEGLPVEMQQNAVDMVSPIWQITFFPFKHQYNSWKALLNDNKSIVVTTGTGSGKTECFMMPLIKDLADNFQAGKVEALFLYPLNALMEDQKNRLSDYISKSNRNLTFAVYNGNTLENQQEAETKGIDPIRLPNELIFRDEIRGIRPNILLTNPTMLEYMLLRPTDQPILDNSQGALKWIVIDETHTFTGAGAAELALLIRRVLIAFGVTADKVRFATSSATIGNGEEAEAKLKEFIADISGKQPDDIEVITGQRVKTDNQYIDYNEFVRNNNISIERIKEIENNLLVNDFIKLTELISERDTIADKLELLDSLCEAGMPAKAHFFFKILDNGLSVKLDDITSNNTFNLYTTEEIQEEEENKSPLLELCRCKKCGNYVALTDVKNSSENTYVIARRETDDDNIFLDDDSEDSINEQPITQDPNQKKIESKRITIGIRPETELDKEKILCGSVLINVITLSSPDDANANLILEIDGRCPYCTESSTNNTPIDDEEIIRGFQSFRVSSEFVSRIIAPFLLNEMTYDGIDTVHKPYNGKQYISFIDSRQGASKGTLKQNIEVERRWVQSRVFHWLNESEINKNKELDKLQIKLNIYNNDSVTFADEITNTINMIQSISLGYKTWSKILDFIIEQPDFNLLCKQFIKKDEFTNGEISEEAKRNYAQLVLFEQFNRRPKSALIAETLGLIQTYYPKLESITELPQAVIEFNNGLEDDKKIDLSDWKDLMKIFLDLTVRSNGSLYFERDDWGTIDIHSSQRFKSQKNPRRSVKKPVFGVNGTNRHVYLLSSLKGWNTPELRRSNKEIIDKVLDAMWNDITRIGLLQCGRIINNRKWVNEKDNPFRLNTNDIALKVCTKSNICPVTNRHIDVTFKGYSPYIQNANAVMVEDTADWNPFPYINGLNNGIKVSATDINDWAAEKRSILVEKGLWTNISNLICSYPDTFIQAEHTAQVDKELARQHQQDFKDHKINILACSTTMEMGVDLGDLELVVMNSIPPMPANYKQRAGRSGRNDRPKSAAVTFCSSDPIGMRTMRNPMAALISRQTAVPIVDLDSPQVVQRHINAFLFKSFVGSMGIFSERIIEFFTPYKFLITGAGTEDRSTVQLNGMQIYPNNGIGGLHATTFSQFIDSLNSLSDDTISNLNSIVSETCFSNLNLQIVINNTIAAIERLYDELSNSFELIKNEWNDNQNLTPAQKKRLNFKFSALLNQKLLLYLSTHQFTPNANMPVNIIDFDLLEEPNNNNWGKNNNPSYELQQALSQYVPGNTVVLNNACYIVRGVKFSNQFTDANAFKQIKQCSTCGKTWIDTIGKKCDCNPTNIKIWNTVNNDKDYLELIEPVGYVRDINEDSNRLTNQNTFTIVRAHLLGADKWSNFDHNRLFDIRSSSVDATSQILYYNIGTGHGFCVCTKCGKTVIENGKAGEITSNIPDDFNDKQKEEENREPRPYHFCITTEYKDLKPRDFHYQDRDVEKIKRNVILGGLVQTDYCEIRIRDIATSLPIVDTNILHTLGLTIANVLSKYIGVERKDISFIALNESICIFDTAKGGAGYSKRLNDIQTMFTVFDLCKLELEECRFKEDILDKSTRQYANKIDIKSTLVWLNQELENRNIVPESILAEYPDARLAKFQNIVDGESNDGEITLFLDNEIEKWNYEEWRNRIIKIKRANDSGVIVNVVVYGDLTDVSLPIRDLLTKINEWAKLFVCQTTTNQFLPLAIVNNQYYFTNDSSQLLCSKKWAAENIYCSTTTPNLELVEFHFPYIPQDSNVIKFTINKNIEISSNELFSKICSYNNDSTFIFQRFKTLCNNQNLRIRYQDEHLKSKLGIIITLQFIKSLSSYLECSIETLVIENEKYEDRNGRENNLTFNLLNSELRNDVIYELWEDKNLKIEPNEKGTMPHWRVLIVECNNHKLLIFPNGGFANGWYIRQTGIYYRFDNTDLDTNVCLVNREELMFDIEIN